MAKKPSDKSNTKSKSLTKKTTKTSKSKLRFRLKLKMPSPKKAISALVVLGVFIFAASAFLWVRYKTNDPSYVFWAAIENNLRSHGATRHISQKDSNLTSNQYIQYSTSAPHLAHGTSEIKQDTRPPIVINTETIGTAYKDYVRYTRAETSQIRADGQIEDFTSILNIWGVSGTDPSSGETGGQFYSDSILNLVPSANLNYQQRHAVMEIMRGGAYSFVPNGVNKRIDDSRPKYVYAISVDFERYLMALKEIAQYVGLTQMDEVDPSDYAGRQPIVMEVTVDVWSKTVNQISLGSSRTERFVSRGAPLPGIIIPEDTIPLGELQTRINIIDQEL